MLSTIRQIDVPDSRHLWCAGPGHFAALVTSSRATDWPGGIRTPQEIADFHGVLSSSEYNGWETK
jgi:hypothetical protein